MTAIKDHLLFTPVKNPDADRWFWALYNEGIGWFSLFMGIDRAFSSHHSA